MAPIKLSIAFALAAATIAPILAQPLGEAHKVTGNVDHLPSHLHHERVPVQSPLEGDNKFDHKHKTHGIPGLEGKGHYQLDGIYGIELQDLAHKDLALAQKGKAHGHRSKAHSKPEIIARDYTESDEMFKREKTAADVRRYFNELRHRRLRPGPVQLNPGRGPSKLPIHRPGSEKTAADVRRYFSELRHRRLRPGPLRLNPGRGPLPTHRPGFGIGPVLSRPRHGFTSTGRPRLPFFGGHGPKVNRPFYNGGINRKFRYGLAAAHRGPFMQSLATREYVDSDDMLERDFEEAEFDVAREYVDFDDMLERDFEKAEVDVAREFTDSDDMVERVFEDLELDARDFDDSELYLD